MKNAGPTIGMCAIGLGLASIGFNLNGNTATATPASFGAGPEQPVIVWYDTSAVISNCYTQTILMYRGWSDGTVEANAHGQSLGGRDCQNFNDTCTSGWFVISSPNEGLNAVADINFDERVDAADLGQMLAAWGDAPRNDYPPIDCPLGLIP